VSYDVGLQGKHCAQGSPVKFGTQLRLQHLTSRRWLHSHHFSSPLTSNQEVRLASWAARLQLKGCIVALPGVQTAELFSRGLQHT
jgi:hypothetical protein